jgi:hypothetical protein
MYALVVDGEIRSVGGLPRAARRLDTGEWVLGFNEYADEATRVACGYVRVVDAVKPTDTDTVTFVRSLELVDGVPTVVWSEREFDKDEIAGKRVQANGDAIRSQAALAVEANKTFLGLASPTNAQIVAQVRSLTRQSNGLVRLNLNLLDEVD